jgi:hypothetical protein
MSRGHVEYSLRLEIVELARGNRSGNVRTKGVERAVDSSFRMLLPGVEQMLATEKNSQVYDRKSPCYSPINPYRSRTFAYRSVCPSGPDPTMSSTSDG